MADYISPDGHIDPEGSWSNETKAYDGDTTTWAQGQGLGNNVWSDFLELTHSAPVYGDKIKYVIKLSVLHGITVYTDIDAYYDGGWHNVWEGAVIGDRGSYQTRVVSLTGGNHYVSKIRFRVKATGVSLYTAALWEAYFYGSLYSNVGLRYYDGTSIRTILCKVLEVNDKIRVQIGNTVYGIPLVLTTNPSAGSIRVYDGSAIYSFPTEVV